MGILRLVGSLLYRIHFYQFKQSLEQKVKNAFHEGDLERQTKCEANKINDTESLLLTKCDESVVTECNLEAQKYLSYEYLLASIVK